MSDAVEQQNATQHKPDPCSRELLSVLTPDSVGPIAMSCLLASQGVNVEVRRQGAHAVEQFQSLVTSFPPNSAEGIFLGRLERVAYSAAATIIEADQEAKQSIVQAQQDYEDALVGASVKRQVYMGLIRWLLQVVLLMGMSFALAKFGLAWVLPDITGDTIQRERTQWLPAVMMFAVPIFIGVGQSIWRVYTVTNLVYQRDLNIQTARRRRRAKQKAAIRYAKEQARLAWDDFVEPGTHLPGVNPTLDLLQVLHMEELRTKVTPPLSIMIGNQMRKWWRNIHLKIQRWRRSKANKATTKTQTETQAQAQQKDQDEPKPKPKPRPKPRPKTKPKSKPRMSKRAAK